MIIKYLDISSFKYVISSPKFVQQFLLSSEFSLSVLFLTSNISSNIIANWASCYEKFLSKWFNWSSSFSMTGSVEVQSEVSISFDITGELGISSGAISWLSFLVRLKESHPAGVFLFMIIFCLVSCKMKFSIAFLLMLEAVFLFIYSKMALTSTRLCLMVFIWPMVSMIFVFQSAKQLSWSLSGRRQLFLYFQLLVSWE